MVEEDAKPVCGTCGGPGIRGVITRTLYCEADDCFMTEDKCVCRWHLPGLVYDEDAK